MCSGHCIKQWSHPGSNWWVQPTTFSCCRALQNLLSGNVTRVSTLRYGDAKTLPAIDVHIKDGLDAVPKRLMQGLNVTYDTGALCWEDSGAVRCGQTVCPTEGLGCGT